MCADRGKGRRNSPGGRPLKMVRSTNVPRNTRSTILAAAGRDDGEAEINLKIQRLARASNSSLLTRPALHSAPLSQPQVDSGAIARGRILRTFIHGNILGRQELYAENNAKGPSVYHHSLSILYVCYIYVQYKSVTYVYYVCDVSTHAGSKQRHKTITSQSSRTYCSGAHPDSSAVPWASGMQSIRMILPYENS